MTTKPAPSAFTTEKINADEHNASMAAMVRVVSDVAAQDLKSEDVQIAFRVAFVRAKRLQNPSATAAYLEAGRRMIARGIPFEQLGDDFLAPLDPQARVAALRVLFQVEG